MNASQSRQIPMVDLLQKLGFNPTKGGIKHGGNRIWYNSPLHADRTASFVINVPENTWHDFADNQHGSPLDFVLKLFNLSFKEGLQKLDYLYNGETSYLANTIPEQLVLQQNWEAPIFKILYERDLENEHLINYLQNERKIPLSLARYFCKEVGYHSYTKGKPYYGIGFKNYVGTYEIRNPYFKGTLGEKSFTYISGENRDEIDIFEGFMDFLSMMVIQDIKSPVPPKDVLVLNSLSLYSQSEIFLIESVNNDSDINYYEYANLWFDNSDQKALTLSNSRLLPGYAKNIQRMNHIYEGFDDLNDYLVKR